MSTSLVLAVVAITLALVLYTVGVFSERRQGILKRSHVVTFWCGLLCDTIGTSTMSVLARGNASKGMTLHGVTGTLAIVLMLFHAVWATVVLAKGDASKQEGFHRLSILVWAIWLVPYVLGMVVGMSH